MAQNIMDRVEELTNLGFKRWQKNGMDRMYINSTTLGLECTYYKTGNISTAFFDGERISNSMGYKLKNAKTYIDLVRGQIVSDSEILAAAAAKLVGADYSWGDTRITL